MNKRTIQSLSFLLVIGSTLPAMALTPREAAICASLKRTSTNGPGALRVNEDTCGRLEPNTPEAPSLEDQDESAIREDLRKMGVQYLFQLDDSDMAQSELPGQFEIQDFMQNAVAKSQTEYFSAQKCLKNDGTPSESFARFDRISKNDSMGGYLLVREKDPTRTNLKSDQGFTVGTWVKLKAEDLSTSGSGYFPVLSKSALNTDPLIGKFEWEFKLTRESVYININRGGQFQSNLNRKLPWWADRFGSCYQQGIHRECWHFVAVSVNPKEHKFSVMFLRKHADELPGNIVESYGIYETSVQENQVPIVASERTPLRIGGSNNSTMDGILKGTFFANRALGRDEIRELAKFTTPSKDASLTCSPAAASSF